MLRRISSRYIDAFWVALIPTLFLITSLITLPHYGISWDEPIHFMRGQSYLHYFLTGKTTFDEPNNELRSYYERNDMSAKYLIEGGDSGHPPLNDILASAFNQIFYKKLHLTGDINGYHVFNVVSASIGVAIVGLFAFLVLGRIGSFVSSLIFATYPLYFGEGHFNVKDPPETAFITGAIFFLWYSLQKKNWKLLFLSSIFSALALGTKFNAFFIPVIVLPYIVFFSVLEVRKHKSNILKWLNSFPRSYRLQVLIYPVIVLGIFFLTWPYLWADPISNFQKIFGYYKDIGTGSNFQPGYYFFGGINAYPAFWILITTPPIVLVLGCIGTVKAVYEVFKKRSNVSATYLLWLSWLLITVIRVTLPNTSIYGGVRQIMEYIPALALLGGLGASWIIKLLKFNFINSTLFVLLLFVPHLFVMINFHPNENVYFNFLTGGLKGAVEEKVPYAGNSFGNAYWPLLQWLNTHAAENAKVALVQGTALNVPDIQLRPDISRWSDYWSGIDRKGEYLIELTYNNYRIAYPYAWDYIDQFLVPVQEVVVDGVSIAKLWKNDIEHTKPSMNKKEVLYPSAKVITEGNDIFIKLSENQSLSHIAISYLGSEKCITPVGTIYTTSDGSTWLTEPEPVPDLQISEKDMIKNNTLTYYFPGRVAKEIRFHGTKENLCILNNPQVKVFILK